MSTANLDAQPTEFRPAHDDNSAMSAVYDSLYDGEVLDGTYHGREPGVRMLGVTNRRLIMLESTTHDSKLALTSVPLARVTSVSRLVGSCNGPDDVDMTAATTVVIKVLYTIYELSCRDLLEAREAHDLVAWNLVTD